MDSYSKTGFSAYIISLDCLVLTFKAICLISINAPQIGKEEIQAVAKVMKSGILTNDLGAGPKVVEFEKTFADFVKAKHAIAVNTGTAALHSTLAAANVKNGDEVILPSFTFVATAEVVVMTGAKPVFADIEPDTYNVSPREIERAITKKTKAILPVDLYGLPANTPEISEIAKKHSLRVIEDAAQVHGGTVKGKPPGSYADAACWSFYGSKNITTGEGGMVTTNDDQLAEQIRVVRSHGEKRKYMSLMVGNNYHMPEIQAAIGVVQVKRLPQFISKRRRNAKRLTARLSKNRRLQLPKEPDGFSSSWYLYTVRPKEVVRERRDQLVQELREKEIGAGVYYVCPIHMMPFYSKLAKQRLPETEKAAKQVFSLPVHPGVSSKQIDYIAKTLLTLLK